MLNPAAANSLAAVRRHPILRPGLALRFVLILTSLMYVVGPTFVQWISLDTIRDEVAVMRIAEAPVVTGTDGAMPSQLAPGQGVPSQEVQTLFANAEGLVGAGLVALGEVHENGGRMGDGLVALVIRGVQVLALGLFAYVLGIRMTIRYQPRHGRGMAMRLMARKG